MVDRQALEELARAGPSCAQDEAKRDRVMPGRAHSEEQPGMSVQSDRTGLFKMLQMTCSNKALPCGMF